MIDLVDCYMEEMCKGSNSVMSRRECCVNNSEGISFDDGDTCYDCIGTCSTDISRFSIMIFC